MIFMTLSHFLSAWLELVWITKQCWLVKSVVLRLRYERSSLVAKHLMPSQLLSVLSGLNLISMCCALLGADWRPQSTSPAECLERAAPPAAAASPLTSLLH